MLLRIIFVCAAIFCLAAVAACGDDDDDGDNGARTATPTPDSQTATPTNGEPNGDTDTPGATETPDGPATLQGTFLRGAEVEQYVQQAFGNEAPTPYFCEFDDPYLMLDCTETGHGHIQLDRLPLESDEMQCRILVDKDDQIRAASCSSTDPIFTLIYKVE
jgi:hypothetical protein